MNLNIDNSWKKQLTPEFEKEYFIKLIEFVQNEYSNHKVYPPAREIFSAFELCKFDDVKIVIIGQDPYHGPGQANGLCFSVRDNMRKPPSLLNIFKEIKSDLEIPVPESGNMERWAKQGIFMINATLTVRAANAGSHQNKGWEIFTDQVIKVISEKKENVIFMLWGAFAQKKEALIDTSKHYILKSVHPSPLSAHRGFFGCKHFSKTNDRLKIKGLKEIAW